MGFLRDQFNPTKRCAHLRLGLFARNYSSDFDEDNLERLLWHVNASYPASAAVLEYEAEQREEYSRNPSGVRGITPAKRSWLTHFAPMPTTVEELFAEPTWLWRLKQLDEKLTGRRLRRIRKNDARRDG